MKRLFIEYILPIFIILFCSFGILIKLEQFDNARIEAPSKLEASNEQLTEARQTIDHLREELKESQFDIEALRMHIAELELPDEELNESVVVIQTPGVGRSSKWHGVAQWHLKHEPHCAWLGCKTPDYMLNVHHIIPFKFLTIVGHPWLELYDFNLITLCHNHHCSCGHLGNYKHFNIDIRADAAAGKLNSRGLSVWSGEEEMIKFLKRCLGKGTKNPPEEKPEILIDPQKAKKDLEACQRRPKTLLAA
ncbi:MAG: hypothetical protein KGI50_06915 [Patescibacteria group bacterium]|nr:hypothetical protein [Patescibacteria group bacterium]MDE2438817.1 hypothetical protein [Patescibacteria group bacterium]